MKAFFRKLVRLKKRKVIKRVITKSHAAWTLKCGRINQTTELFISSSQEIQSINNQTTYTGAQKSELTYSQEDLDALAVSKLAKKSLKSPNVK